MTNIVFDFVGLPDKRILYLKQLLLTVRERTYLLNLVEMFILLHVECFFKDENKNNGERFEVLKKHVFVVN